MKPSARVHSLSVAVIGGGISGLACANRLSAQSGVAVTVFDTGRLRPGGRASSRVARDPPKDDDKHRFKYLDRATYDHTAQVLAATSAFPEFAQQAEVWRREGILTAFPKDSLYSVGGVVAPVDSKGMYYGSPGEGLSAVSAALAKALTVKQDVWVSPSNGVKYVDGRWRVQAKGRVLGTFDRLVIAHNGKCADRLMSKTPARAVHQLLRVNFSPTVPAHGGKRMTLNSIYSLTFALPAGSAVAAALPRSFLGGFVQNEPALRFLTHQTRKYPLRDGDFEVWTVLSSPKFATKHKAAQEFLSEDIIQEVSTELLAALGRSIGLAEAIHPLEVRLQLWGAAVPLNVWDTACIYDAEHNVGVCGDWLVDPSLAGAYTSGIRLAEHMLGDAGTVGLQGCFQRSEAAAQQGLAALSVATPSQLPQP